MAHVGLYLVILAMLVSIVNCTETHCNVRGTGYRCAKDNYKADEIRLVNNYNHQVRVQIGMWMSWCGWPGRNNDNLDYTLEPGQTKVLWFGKADKGNCNEFFVHGCEKEGKVINCSDAVNVSVV